MVSGAGAPGICALTLAITESHAKHGGRTLIAKVLRLTVSFTALARCAKRSLVRVRARVGQPAQPDRGEARTRGQQ